MLIISDYTKEKASQARALLKTMDLCIGQGLWWKPQVPFSCLSQSSCVEVCCLPRCINTHLGNRKQSRLQEQTLAVCSLFSPRKHGSLSWVRKDGKYLNPGPWIYFGCVGVSELIAEGQLGIFVLETFWVYRSFHPEVFISEKKIKISRSLFIHWALVSIKEYQKVCSWICMRFHGLKSSWSCLEHSPLSF